MLIIVNTGVANLASVYFACERLGVKAVISSQPDQIRLAKRIILPGVGAAPFAMQSLHKQNLCNLLSSLSQPILGICLGMQLLFERLNEGSGCTGLGLIPGTINRLDSHNQPIPHMGWNQLQLLAADPILDGVKNGEYVYFVHSYAAPLLPVSLAKTQYGQEFSAIVRYKNVYGCQFHPERSGQTGMQILHNFLNLAL